MCVQIVLGIIAHWVKFNIPKLHTASGRGPAHFLHVGVGLATVIVGWVTVWYGEFDFVVFRCLCKGALADSTALDSTRL
jgi:hypothetical protein